jgi:hypothetical protein
LVSKEQASFWGRDTEVGIHGSIELGRRGRLEVSIEKDFACLDRSDDENADTFMNPHADAVCTPSISTSGLV